MKLEHILAGAGLRSPLPDALGETDVKGLAYDSRKVAAGYLFFAFEGAKAGWRAVCERRDCQRRGGGGE